MSSLLAKLLARIGFFIALAIFLPLAVQNRQMVDIYLNPFSLLDNQPPAVSLPLFIALFLALGIGLFIGYALGCVRAARRDNARSKTADILSRLPATSSAGTKNSPSGQASVIQSGDTKKIAQQAHTAGDGNA